MFQIGQQVICINNNPHVVPFKNHTSSGSKNMCGLTTGEVYTIISFYDASDNDDRYSPGYLCCVLKEIERGTTIQPGFWVERFRPLKDTSLDIFREMCEKDPEENLLEVINSEFKEEMEKAFNK